MDRLQAAALAATRRIHDLRGELEGIAESTEAVPDDEHDAEGSTVGFERARVSALLVRAEASLREIDAAVERRRIGTYGRCEACGAGIGSARLAALPATGRCVTCAAAG